MTRPSSVEQELGARDAKLADVIKQHAHPLMKDGLTAYDPLIDMIDSARIVMIGDGSHGTHEFYRERALITKRLIEEKGFTFVGIEGPTWSSVSPLNQYVQGGPGTAEEALGTFDRFPLNWVWVTRDVQHFLEWLRRHNSSLPKGQQKVAFYGMDVLGFPAVSPVLQYLDTVDPSLAQRARERYSWFARFGGADDVYGYYAGTGLVDSCERQAVEVLQDLRNNRGDLIRASNESSYFNALMAALAVSNGERFHRADYSGNESAGDLRDHHMQDMLDAVLDHFEGAKVVVWAHNLHVGDFPATGDGGGINLGQLARQRHSGEMVTVGFGQYEGSVTAARYWGGPIEYMAVPPGIPGSYDSVFHDTGLDRFLLLLRPLRDSPQAGFPDERRGHRNIPGLYHPEDESHHYVPTKLADCYDAFVHIDHTHATKPLDLSVAKPESVPAWEAETYPDEY